MPTKKKKKTKTRKKTTKRVKKKTKVRKRTSKKVKKKTKVRKRTSKRVKKKNKVAKDNGKPEPELIIKTRPEWIKSSLATKNKYQDKYSHSIKKNDDFLDQTIQKN
jgi:acetyl-CoA synthetase